MKCGMDYYSALGRFARLLPAETAHEAAICALKYSLVPKSAPVANAALKINCFGLSFSNPVGIAAGFDKNAEVVGPLLGQGFGFVEAGTVTPLPQPGNPRPRVFRLAEDAALINRLGFNNKGVHVFADNLKKNKTKGIVGANIGKNKDSLDTMYDYATSLEAVYPHVDYITVNISSPNTVGLRDLQQKATLSELMQIVAKKRDELTAVHGGVRKPMLYKIAPDLTQQDKEDIVEVALAHHVDGLIVTNTTITRPNLTNSSAGERGGLSGKPLFMLSTDTLRDIYRISGGKIPLIGVGGIASAEDAYAKIRAGASLVQLYTALVYQGFGLVRQINEGLIKLLERDGFKSLSEAVGKGR